ncbi:MAG: DNA-directed RNA polymerase subunit omega [Actinomycetota bacterium]|nr:DNA-directed RNA polymerase subunit omega [Actinomycetota bacterium]
MLSDLKIDELLEKVDSRYGLVMASAKRARQINEYTATLGLNDSLGIPGPQVHTRSQHPLSIAIEELRAGKLKVGFREEATPEEEATRAEAREDEPVSTDAAAEEAGADSDDEEGQGAA